VTSAERAGGRRKRRARPEAVYRGGEVIGRRVVFIRDNQFVKPHRGRRAAG
jgi:hypothetical protein